MAGRRPKPTAQRILEGNPGKRPLNKTEPKYGGVPTCPPELNAAASKEWKRICGELTAQGMLTSVDRAALAAYCVNYVRWLNAEEQIEKFGAVIRSPKSGYPVQNPYVGVSNTAQDQMRKFLVEFGMTPASRTRLKVDSAPKGGDRLAAFMQGIRPLSEENQGGNGDEEEAESIN